jgi:hypothetical protein
LTVGEVYYKRLDSGWEIQFFKNNFYVKCNVSYDDLVKEESPLLKPIPGMSLLKHMDNIIHGNKVVQEMTDEQQDTFKKEKIAQFEVTFLKDAIKVIDFVGE